MVMCDAHVEQLRDKRQQWIDCIDGEDDNSITNQLVRITWNITVFRVLMEAAVTRAPKADEGGQQVNGLLFGLLQESFTESLLLGFRRLMDMEGLEGKKDVYSLMSLLVDIGGHSHLLTRDAIIRLGPPPGNRGELWLQDWPEIKHSLIDYLTDVAGDQRSPHDRIPRKLFDDRRETLQTKFKKAEGLINKEIAHAATPISRRGLDYKGILWGDLYELHCELCKTAHFLLDVVCETSMNSLLPVFQGDEFQYLSRPIVTDTDFQRLANRWGELKAEYESWRHWRRSSGQSRSGSQTPN